MVALATAMPGFVSCENVAVVEFASEAEQMAWRNQAEQRDAQERGRREFFSEYQIQVRRVERAYRFNPAEGRVEVRGRPGSAKSSWLSINRVQPL
jgi:heme-degrading monooxygenase HmoA